MTLQELRNKIAESNEADWFNSVELEIDFPHLRISHKLTGVSAVYEFVSTQVNGWSKKGENIPKELKDSRDFFESIKESIQELFERTYQREALWRNISAEFDRNNNHYFTFDSPEVDFLIKVNSDYPDSFAAAYNFIVGDINRGFDDKDNIIGSLLAYEFSLKDNSQISERKNAERASLSRIRNEFQKYLADTETEVNNYLRKTNEKYEEYSAILNQTKEQKEETFDKWFESSKASFGHFDSESKQKITDLEKAYEELLSLKKPTEYWNRRATILKKEGRTFLNWLIGLLVFGCITLYLLLWLTPEGMLLSFIKGQASAIKWSVVYVTFISLLAFGIKILSKAMFSSYHLARDAEEKEQLTYVYLAMIKESAVDDKDKTLIMQSLFSRADTGLLKDDSSPTMPGNMLDKIASK